MSSRRGSSTSASRRPTRSASARIPTSSPSTTIFSRRLELGPSNSLAASRAAREKAGGKILDLMELNPTRAGIVYPEEEIRAALAEHASLRYDPDPLGPRAAREAVARDYARRGIEIPPERICLVASTSEGFSFLFKLLADPGDGLLVPRPGYPLFDHLAPLEGLALEGYGVEEETGGLALPATPPPRTRAILLVAPHAPTGRMPPEADLRALDALRGGERRTPILLDEVFADYADGPPARPDPKAGLVFRLGGLSKTAGMPGLKISWIGLDGDGPEADEALERLETIADAYLSPNQIVAASLPALLEIAPRIRAGIYRRLRENHESLGASPLAPRLRGTGAAWTTQVAIGGDDEAAALELLDVGVYLHPGYFYDYPAGTPRLVFSLLTPTAVLAEALPTLVSALTR